MKYLKIPSKVIIVICCTLLFFSVVNTISAQTESSEKSLEFSHRCLSYVSIHGWRNRHWRSAFRSR